MRSALLITLGLAAGAGGFSRVCAMSVADLQAGQLAGAKITVVDVRSATAFAQEHIPGAINVPAAVCARKTLPALGQVVVCGDGLLGDPAEQAAAALAAKPGLTVETLDGGLAGWKAAGGLTTRAPGLQRETFNYISYARLKAANVSGVVLLDLRKPAAKGRTLTDLAAEFPGARVAKTRAEVAKPPGNGAANSMVVLIDNGDGSSEAEARQLKAGGVRNCTILAGGELIVARHGQAGLDRASSSAGPVNPAAAQTK